MGGRLVIPNFLTLRNASEQIKRLLRVIDEAPAAERPSIIRLPPGLVRKGNEKRSVGTRDVGCIHTIVGHVTDVRGGFGVQKWGPDGWHTWLKRLHAGDIPSVSGEAFSLLNDIKDSFGWQPDEQLARTLALCSRYAQTPYHYIASRKLGVLENRPLSHRTWAAGAGNVGVSIAIDCHHREEVPAELAHYGRAALNLLHEDLVAGDPSGRPIRYTVHGQWSRQRWNDTHRETHMAVFKPGVEDIRDLGYDIRIDYEAAVGGGRALTTRDDPDAHFDPRGRRVRRPTGELL